MFMLSFGWTYVGNVNHICKYDKIIYTLFKEKTHDNSKF